VKEAIEEAGWIGHESKVGHANIKKQMIEEGALMAGEVSGHYYFNLAGYIAEMGTLPAILLLDLMSRTGQRLSELVDDVKRYAHSGELNFKVEDAKGIMAMMKGRFTDGTISELDGVKIVYPNWWFSLRSSNTEPLLRLNLEADDEETLRAKLDELLPLIGGERE
jgi:phosphomannomutase